MWWSHDAGWAIWLVMALGMTSSWVLLVALLLGLGRWRLRSVEDQRELLARRLACGEIDREEYDARLAALAAHRR